MTPWTLAHQAPLFMGFPRQEYWSGLPFPPPGDLPDSRTETTSPVSPTLAVDSLPLSHLGSPISGKTILLLCACNSFVPHTIYLTEINICTTQFLITHSFKEDHVCLGQTDSNWRDTDMRRLPRRASCLFENRMTPCRAPCAFPIRPR